MGLLVAEMTAEGGRETGTAWGTSYLMAACGRLPMDPGFRGEALAGSVVLGLWGSQVRAMTGGHEWMMMYGMISCAGGVMRVNPRRHPTGWNSKLDHLGLVVLGAGEGV